MDRFYRRSSSSLFSFSRATVKNVGMGPELELPWPRVGGPGLGPDTALLSVGLWAHAWKSLNFNSLTYKIKVSLPNIEMMTRGVNKSSTRLILHNHQISQIKAIHKLQSANTNSLWRQDLFPGSYCMTLGLDF